MRTLTTALLLTIILLVGSLFARGAAAAPLTAVRAHSYPVDISLSIGYGDIYRGTAWTPVRATLRNLTDNDVSGTLEIPENGQSASLGTSPTFHGLYRLEVQLPAGGTKHVTLYVPGASVQGQLSATFRAGTRTLGARTSYALGIDTGAALIGVMSTSPADYGWIRTAIQQHVTAHVVRLDVGTLDPVPDALSALDMIVLTNSDTSQLDAAQVNALRQYVRNGGSLLLVGGPGWAQTLGPLPSSLLPGTISGTRAVPRPDGLAALAETSRPGQVPPITVSVLSHPRGTAAASAGSIPLVVRNVDGKGVIEYLAFDPSLQPVQNWAMKTGTLEHLLVMAAPLAVTHTWTPQGFRGRARRAFGALATTGELGNSPPVRLSLFDIIAILTLLYVVLMGPANFLVLRRLGRPNLVWITIPVISLTYLLSTAGIAGSMRSSSVMLNSIGLVTLDGQAATHPATFYLGLTPPFAGTYSLSYSHPALAATIPQFSHFSGFFWRSSGTLTPSPVGMWLTEGTHTDLTYLNMPRWSTRDSSLSTSVSIRGTVQGDLHLDPRGNLVGTLHNNTNLDLYDPVLVAGQAEAHVGTIKAGAALYVRFRPSADTSTGDGANTSVWNDLYDSFGDFGDGGFGPFGECCDSNSFNRETTMLDRVRNASAMLSRIQDLQSLGQTVLVGWTDRPLNSYQVNGVAPSRRDLTMIAVPLAVHLPSHGSFRFPQGTWAPHLVDLVPRAPQSSNSNFFSRAGQRISIGAGGSLTFEFDTHATPRVRFTRLTVSVNVDTSTFPASVYDWRVGRWDPVDVSGGDATLPNPARFVSSAGRILLRMEANGESGDISIDDPSNNIQIDGAGVVL